MFFVRLKSTGVLHLADWFWGEAESKENRVQTHCQHAGWYGDRYYRNPNHIEILEKVNILDFKKMCGTCARKLLGLKVRVTLEGFEEE